MKPLLIFQKEIGELPLITDASGVVLTVNDLGTVRDNFQDTTAVSEINGEPAMVVNVERAKTEDLLAMVDAVKAYVAEKKLPPGYRFEVWGDSSKEVRGRLALLLRNGFSGLLLVFLVLTLFLEMRLAFWVALGIPISILGAGAVLAWGDQTINMLSLFSFLIALGIVLIFLLPLWFESVRSLYSQRLLVFLGFVSYPLYLMHQNLVTGAAISLYERGLFALSWALPILPILAAIALAYIIAKIEPVLKNVFRDSFASLFSRYKKIGYGRPEE